MALSFMQFSQDVPNLVPRSPVQNDDLEGYIERREGPRTSCLTLLCCFLFPVPTDRKGQVDDETRIGILATTEHFTNRRKLH